MSAATYVDVEARVRSNTTAASLTAGTLIFFGFMVFDGPSGEGLFHTGDVLFHIALRLGGLTMIAVAILSAIGTPYALFTDAIVSGLTGMALCVSAALMSTGNTVTLTYCVYFVSGFTLVISGLRNWRDYGALPRIYADDGSAAAAIEAYDPFGASDAKRVLDKHSAKVGPQESTPIVLQPKKKSFPKRPSSVGSEDDVIHLDD